MVGRAGAGFLPEVGIAEPGYAPAPLPGLAIGWWRRPEERLASTLALPFRALPFATQELTVKRGSCLVGSGS